jgi:hypothetical protein
MSRFLGTLLVGLLQVGMAMAANCQSNGNGNWSAAGTWANCNGTTPQPADTVQIRGGNTVTMNATATVASLQVGSTSGNNTSTLQFAALSQLTVNGTVTLSGNNGNRGGVTNMASGGTLIIAGSPAFALGSGPVTWTPGSGTVQLTANNVLPYSAGVFDSFNHLIIASGTTTLGGNTAVTGNLTVNGQLAGTFAISLTGSGTTIGGTGSISNTGTITITNNKTVLGTASLSIAGPVTVSTGTTTNNGSICLGLSGGVCPSVTGDTLTVTGTFANTGTLSTSSAISVSGTLTNTGTVTTSDTATGIAGAGTFTNSANATLNIQGPLTVTTFTATAAGNTVNYTGSASQNVRATSYYNLTLSGTRAGNVTLPNGGTVNVAGTFSPSATFTSGGYVVTGNAFVYNGTGAQTIAAFNYNDLTITGARGSTNVTLANSGTIGIAGVFNPAATFNVGFGYVNAGSTVDFNGTGAQTVPAFSYNNLTLSGIRTGANNVTLVNGGSINIAGTFNPAATFGTGGYVVTGNTVNFNGSGAQTIPAFSFNSLTISGARTTNSVTLANGGTIGVAATFSVTATFSTGGYVVTGNTVDFNGTGAQTVPAFNYNNLTISGARTTNNVTLANGGTVGVAGAFNTSTATFTSGGYVVTNNTVEYNGAAAQTLNVFTYAGLRINNSIGVTLSAGNATVSGTLSLNAGVVTTVGASTVISTGSCTAPSVSRTSGHVAGRLQKAIPTGSTACTFEIGGATAAAYTPVTLTFTSITTGGSVLASVAGVDHPSLSGSGIDTAKSVNRYWTLATPVGAAALPSAAAGNTFSAVFNFLAVDLDAGAATGSFVLKRYSGSTWSAVTVGTKTATSTQGTGLLLSAGYGDFAIGEAAVSNFAREKQFIYTREQY